MINRQGPEDVEFGERIFNRNFDSLVYALIIMILERDKQQCVIVDINLLFILLKVMI